MHRILCGVVFPPSLSQKKKKNAVAVVRTKKSIRHGAGASPTYHAFHIWDADCCLTALSSFLALHPSTHFFFFFFPFAVAVNCLFFGSRQ